MSPAMAAVGNPALDPYQNPTWASVVPSSHKRVAAEVYWKMRASAPTVRQWMSAFYPGSKTEQLWADLYQVAQNVDLTLQMAWDTGGYAGVCTALESDDRVEVGLSRIGAEINYIRTGEKSMREALQAGMPPGFGDIMPAWAVESAQASSKALFQQRGRVCGRGRGSGMDGDSDDGGGGRRPRRRRAPGRGAGGDSKGVDPKAPGPKAPAKP